MASSPMHHRSRWFTGILAFFTAITTIGLVAPAAQADDSLTQAGVTIDKSVTVDGTEYDLPDAPTVTVGEQFDWYIDVTCNQNVDQCVNATLTDVIPDGLEIVKDAVYSSQAAEISVSGQTVTVAFKENLVSPSGAFGLSSGAQVRIPVKLTAIDQSRDGEVFTNTASIVADNATVKTDDAAVTANVPVSLVAAATKTFSDTSLLAQPGASVGVTFGGSNNSNTSVSSLTLQDPADPNNSVFQQYLAVASLGDVSWPEGATRAVVSVTTDGSTWTAGTVTPAGQALSLPGGVTASDIRAVRVEFQSDTASIPVGASASVGLALTQRDSVSALTSETTIPNESSAVVGLDSQSSAIATKDASLVLRPIASSVSASKSFSPERIATTGNTTSSLVTLGAKNTGTVTLSELTIAEPTDPASDTNILSPAFAEGGVTFAGFSSGITWPAGATEATITYSYSDSTNSSASTSSEGTLPAPTDGKRVIGFVITFAGSIEQGAEAEVPFTVNAPASMNTDMISGTNEITVSGTGADDLPDPADKTASDDLTVYGNRIAISTTKSLTRDTLWARSGQSTTAKLTATIANYPETTVRAKQVIIDDPQTTTGLTDWYNYFDATAVTLAQIPTNATLTVQYRDADGNFYDIPGMVDISGSTNGIFSGDIPASLRDDIYGIRFIYSSDDGFTAGQTFSPNLTFATRETLRDSGEPLPTQAAEGESYVASLENCSASQGSNGATVSNRAELESCPVVNLLPTDEGPGTGVSYDKSWTPDLVFSHSRQNTTANLTWGLGGVQGVDKIIITEPGIAGDGEPGSLADSVFDTFNVTTIGPIKDAQFAYDQVTVQLFNSSTGQWEDASTCTTAAPCSGTSIPAITLTSSEQQTTTGVRFIVTEKANRNPSSVDQPQAGSGISTGDGRVIPLTFQLRDTLRSDSDIPVVEGPTYNTNTASEVLNSSTITGYIDDEKAFDVTDSDTVQIVDPDLGITASKTWDGSPVTVPQDWNTQAIPTTRVTLSATNTTASGVTSGGQAVSGIVDSLQIVEPGAISGNADSPFEVFDLVRVQAMTAPAGTTNVKVDFTATGNPIPSISEATASAALAKLQAMSESDLRTVTGLTVTYSGSIASGSRNGTGTLVLDLELRQTERTSGDTVTQVDNAVVYNDMLATVSDRRYNGESFVSDTLSDDATADVKLQEANIGVNAAKTFSVASQTEPNNSAVTMTLAATPTGSERTKSIVITDDAATFWNAYDYSKVSNTLTLPTFSPANNAVVQFSVCTGRTFDAAAIAAASDAGCEATGGTWSEWSSEMSQTQARTWAPASGTDVQGIRIKVSRQGGSQWANPFAPTVQIPLEVVRRAELRTGGEVPSTLSTGTIAPGETVLGVTTNVVKAHITGIWGGQADNSATATITYKHAKNGVQVKKDPTGVKAPGQVFPYTLTFTNTGDRDVVDPVVVDSLPWSDTLGTLVQFDPDEAEGAVRYTYTLSGSNATNGTPMPTDAASVTVVEDLDSDTPTLTFTFPEGTTFAPGQTYTISFEMVFVPGVLAGQDITNTFGVSGDRPWDTCTAPNGYTASLSEDATTCSTSATVQPTTAASVRGIKSVRPLDSNGDPSNEYGFLSVRTRTSAAQCAEIAAENDGYSKYPCVPRTAPGQTEEWQLTLTNDGTANATQLVVADYLPVTGDSTLVADLIRNSQWDPTFTGQAPKLVDPASGQTLTVYESTASKEGLCMTGVNDPTKLASCLDQTGTDASKWVPLGTNTASDVTALLFVVDGTVVPGGQVNITFTTTTPAYSANVADADSVANNSLTVSMLWDNDGKIDRLRARDQSMVGIALITGSVKISKSITGDAAEFVPEDLEFSGTLVCESAGVEIPGRDFTIKNGETIQIDNLPYGASCYVEESDETGQTTATSTTVTVPDGLNSETVPTVDLTNTYELTSLTVSKSVDTTADNFPSGFAFDVECSFLGEPIDLGEDASFTLNADESRVIEGLPVNATCTVTETDARGADSTVVEAESVNSDDSAHGTVTEDNEARSAELDGLATSSGTNSVDFTNNFGSVAQLEITKELVGGAADLAVDTTFTVDVVCEYQGEELLNTQFELNKGNGWSQFVPSLVAGTDCTITEPDLQGADGVVITPNNDEDQTVGTVTISEGETEPVAVTVTNRYLAGSLHVTKDVTGDGAATYGTADFEVTLECTLNGEPVRIPDGATRTVSAENPGADYTGLPNGALCTLTETSDGGATVSTIRQGDSEWSDAATGVTFTVVADPAIASNDDQAQVGVEVDNRFDLAEVSVTKHVDTAAVDAEGNPIAYGPFTVAIECTFNGQPVEIEQAERTIADGETVVWNGLPAGGDCTVTETDSAGAVSTVFERTDVNDTITGTQWTLTGLEPVGAEIANSATLINSYDVGTIAIAKVIDGSAAKTAEDKTFTVDVECVLTDASHPEGTNVWNGTVELNRVSDWRAQITNVAAGASCVVTEANAGGADSTSISVGGKKYDSTTSTVLVGANEDVNVQVTNTFIAKLPDTGIDVRGLAIAVVVLLAGGALAVVISRRKREE